jgi:hypothetical protein
MLVLICPQNNERTLLAWAMILWVQRMQEGCLQFHLHHLHHQTLTTAASYENNLEHVEKREPRTHFALLFPLLLRCFEDATELAGL